MTDLITIYFKCTFDFEYVKMNHYFVNDFTEEAALYVMTAKYPSTITK